MRKDVIQPLHLTLREFLVDEKCCIDKEFHNDCRVHHLQAARSCLRIMNKELCHDMCELGNALKDEVEGMDSHIQEHIPLQSFSTLCKIDLNSGLPTSREAPLIQSANCLVR